MIKLLKYILVAILLIFSLFYIFVFNNNQEVTKSFFDSNTIQDMILVDFNLDKEISQISQSTFSNYDKLVELTKEFRRLFKKLEKDNFEIYSSNEFQTAKDLITIKFDLIDSIKRLNSILKNSLQFIPSVINAIYRDNSVSKELILTINELRFNLNYLKESFDDTFLESTLKKLDDLKSDDENLSLKLNLFKQHFKLILKNIPIQHNNIKNLESIDSKELFDKTLYLIEESRSEKIKSSHTFEILSLSLIFIMSITVYLISKREELYYKSFLKSLKVDYLTKDLNRYSFIKDIKKIDNLAEFVIVSFDINKFRFINDRYGVDEADSLLLYISKELNKVFKNAKIYKVSSNTFNILLPVETKFDNLASNISNIVKFANIDFDFSIAIYYLKNNETYKEIHSNIQATLYSAKLKSANKIVVYKESDKAIIHYKTLSKNSMFERERILNALKEDRFILFYQPILNIKTQKIIKYEALVRLKENDKILPPFKFIQIAEEFNLISEITKVVIKKAFMLASTRLDVEFSINLSGKDVSDRGFLDYIKKLQEEFFVNPKNITFEITETEALIDIKESIDFIFALKKYGFKFAIDDFGIGESSLRYLKDLPVDYIKIDGSFIKTIESDLNDREFVKYINQIIKLYGKKSVAEFVENENILALLKDLDIDLAQGYHIGKPESFLIT